MALTQKTEIILLVFVCVSIPVYIIFLLALIVNRKKKPFNSHFFHLSISLGIADLATVFHSYLFIRIPGWGWLLRWYVDNGPHGSFLASYALSLQFALSGSQHLGVLLISFNRFSALVLNNYYDSLWTKNKFFFAVFLQWFLPAILYGVMAPQSYYYSEYYDNVTDNCQANIDFSDRTTQTIFYAMSMCINLVINILTFISYAVTFYISLRQTKQRSSTIRVLPAISQTIQSLNTVKQEEDGRRRSRVLKYNINYAREMKLALSGFFVFVSMLIYFVFLVFIAVTENFNMAFLWYIASDVFSCINPYTLLVMSKETRKQFFNLARCRK